MYVHRGQYVNMHNIQLFEEIVFSFRTVTCLKKVEITIGQNI